MRCEDIKEDLVSFVLDELEEERKKAIQAHLNSCEKCRAEVAEYRRTLAALSRWKVPAHGRPPNFAFLPAPPLPIESRQPGKRRVLKTARSIVGLVVAAVLVIGLIFSIRIDYRDGVLSINIGTMAGRYAPAESARIAAIVDSVRQHDVQLFSKMIAASETRQSALYHADLASYTRQLDAQQQQYFTYLMDHIYTLQQQDRVAYYQSSAALDGVVKLASSVR